MHRVLIAEDETLVAMGMILSLESAGFEVRAVGHGQRALELLVQGFRPDVVVTDFMMPIMNGLELTKLIRQRPELDSVPILLISAVPEECLPDGTQFDAYVSKPCGEDRLIEAIRELIDGKVARCWPPRDVGSDESPSV